MTKSNLDDRIEAVAHEIMSSAPCADFRLRVIARLDDEPTRGSRSHRPAVWWIIAFAAIVLLALVMLRRPDSPEHTVARELPAVRGGVPKAPAQAASAPNLATAVKMRLAARTTAPSTTRQDADETSDIAPEALAVDPVALRELPPSPPLDLPALGWAEIVVQPIVVDEPPDKRQELR
jgi:hypothetical protein